jgi:general secretion pathway protein G
MKKYKTKNNKNGFTLIELLVVVLIISILSGLLLTVINPTGVRRKTRDSQRKADLKKVQAALELYYADYRQYPDTATAWQRIGLAASSSNQALANNVNGNYINTVPRDPKGLEGDATYQASFSCGGAYDYSYKTSTGGGSYVLTASMEVSTSASDSLCSNVNNTSLLSCSAANCYAVENP